MYGSDQTEDLMFMPSVVLRPSSVEEVSAILKIANRYRVPVTPRAGGTGLSGGALAVHGGILLSMERFNRIVEIDERNLQARVEPGVINQVFRDAVEEKGLFYPPDPASKGSCHLGGNLAENSGGPKAVKYGVTRDYVLNCQVVLPTGEVIWTGANVLKNATGYNLTQLMIGSEGTLGIITQIVFRLIPLPRKNKLLLVPFRSASRACEAVSAVFRAGITPSAMEFMEKDAIRFVRKYIDVTIPVDEADEAHLLIEVDGNDEETLFREAECISGVVEQFECGEILFADSESQKSELWKMRRSVAEAVKAHSVYKEEDTVVPRAELPALLSGVKKIAADYGFQTVCYGHAGDGNLHVNILKGTLSQSAWDQILPGAIARIFELCVGLGGTLSGEHGIGWVQKNYLPIALTSETIALQRGIKQVFDPNGILNPGKIFPEIEPNSDT